MEYNFFSAKILSKIHLFIKKSVNLFGEIVAPPFCVNCTKGLKKRVIFCIDCYALIQPIVSHPMIITSRYQMPVFAIGDYKDPLKKLVMKKYYGDFIGSRQLGQLIWSLTTIRCMHFDYIIPVPLHWVRQIRRGFNQAQEISVELGKASDIPVANTILRRTRYTKSQSEINRLYRKLNVHNAFTLIKSNNIDFRGKQLLLVDDVMTTGATLHAAARELIKLKPKSISAVVACRGV